MDFNFDALESVNRANPIKNRAQTWRLKRGLRPAGPVFTFSQSLFDELNMSSNSLDIMYDPTSVFIAVCNDNEGKWARTSKKGKKGKTFKNEELAKLLDERGLTVETLNVESIGINPKDSREYYRIIAFVDNVGTDVEGPNTEPAMEMGNSPNESSVEASDEPLPEEAVHDAGPSTPGSDDF
jgi:hypothetical protein